MVSQAVGAACPKRVVNLSLPDEPMIAGNSGEVFDYYGLNAEGIAECAEGLLKEETGGGQSAGSERMKTGGRMADGGQEKGDRRKAGCGL